MSDFDPAVHSLAFVPHGGTAKDLDYCPAEDIAAALKPIINTDRYATALSLTVTDGQLTGSVTMSEGDPLTATVTLPDDVSVESGTYAVNAACQVTLPKSDGDSVTIDLCDLVSEMSQVVNPNGSITVTHSAGGVDETFTIPAPAPVYGACDIDGNVTIPAPDGTEFLTDAIVKRECVNDNLEMETTTKGGVVQKEVWRPVKVRQSVNSSLITAATAVGELYHPDICQFVPASSCGGTVDLVGYNSVNGNGPSDGFLTLRHFASTTGGAVYSPIFTGGVSEQQLLSDGETHPTNVFFSTLPPGGALICYRTTVFANSITAGRADVATQSAYFTHMECRTC